MKARKERSTCLPVVAQRRPKSTRGFTLVELLIALAVLSLLAVSLQFALVTAMRLRTSCRDHLDELQARRDVLATFEADLGNLAACTPNCIVSPNLVALACRPLAIDESLELPGACLLVQYHWVLQDSTLKQRQDSATPDEGHPRILERAARRIGEADAVRTLTSRSQTRTVTETSSASLDTVSALNQGPAGVGHSQDGLFGLVREPFTGVRMFLVSPLVLTERGLEARSLTAADSIVALRITLQASGVSSPAHAREGTLTTRVMEQSQAASMGSGQASSIARLSVVVETVVLQVPALCAMSPNVLPGQAAADVAAHGHF
jgi:prepilin-type N-terminal cleavage/methylation domain-containing protein